MATLFCKPDDRGRRKRGITPDVAIANAHGKARRQVKEQVDLLLVVALIDESRWPVGRKLTGEEQQGIVMQAVRHPEVDNPDPFPGPHLDVQTSGGMRQVSSAEKRARTGIEKL